MCVCVKAMVVYTVVAGCVCVTAMVAQQWASKYGWTIDGSGMIFVSNQEESIKTKNITEKITFDSKNWHFPPSHSVLG